MVLVLCLVPPNILNTELVGPEVQPAQLPGPSEAALDTWKRQCADPSSHVSCLYCPFPPAWTPRALDNCIY